MSRSCKRRGESIDSFISAVEIIKSEIVFKNGSVEDIFSILPQKSNGASSDFFQSLCRDRSELALDTILNESDIRLKKYDLKQPEIDEIYNILKVLGKYDLSTQTDFLNKAINRLEDIYAKADEEYSKNGKLYKAIGVTIGLIIGLLLL